MYANSRTHRRRARHHEKIEAGKPLGGPPRNFTAAEKAVFNELKAEWPWADRSHRKFVVSCAKTMAKHDRLNRYFSKRMDAALAAGKSQAEAVESVYMNGDTVHPKLADLRATENELWESLKVWNAHRDDVETSVALVAGTATPESPAARYFR